MKRDVLSVIEAAYAPAPDADAWLGTLAAEAGPLLDRGLGAYFARYEAPRERSPFVRMPVLTSGRALGFDTTRTDAVFSAARTTAEGRTALGDLFPRVPSVATAMDRAGASLGAAAFERFWPGAPEDRPANAFAALAGDPSGHGVMLCATMGTRDRIQPRERRAWFHLAAHVASAYRLVRRARADVDAVLRPDGGAEHTEPEGQSHEAIAYELGIGVSTVGTHLKGAARKLGVTSRLALVRAYPARREVGPGSR